MITKHLQLKGEVASDGWRFPPGTSVGTKSIERQLDHWCTVLAKKKEGRRALVKAGYTLTIRLFVSGGSIVVSSEKIDTLTRHGLGLEVVFSPDPE